MAMNGNDRGDAAYNSVAGSNPDFAKLSPAEQNTLKSYFRTIYSADTGYITSNAEADPGTLAFDPSEVVAPPGTGGGPCSGAGDITLGKGTIS